MVRGTRSGETACCLAQWCLTTFLPQVRFCNFLPIASPAQSGGPRLTWVHLTGLWASDSTNSDTNTEMVYNHDCSDDHEGSGGVPSCPSRGARCMCGEVLVSRQVILVEATGPSADLSRSLSWAGIPEDSKVEGPAFTDAIRMYRQSKELYGTWEMLCGNEVQILSNLVMEELGPELKAELAPRLKGKPQERQRQWIQAPSALVLGPAAGAVPTAPVPMQLLRPQISDAVYRMVYEQAKARFEEVLAKVQQAQPAMKAIIRTDMDQIITSKEHLASKIRASVAFPAFILPKAEVCVRNHVQPYIPSILEALMVPTSQGFTEVRDVFFKEVTDMNLNVINEGGIDKLGEYMEKLSRLAFHPLKMHSCYEKMESLRLDGLQQRFDVSSTSVFKQRAQIHMREVDPRLPPLPTLYPLPSTGPLTRGGGPLCSIPAML
ncbi:Protein Niban 2 [Saguinus oedipus]|uniref:Protein Niban 2 n=1 Tax=Saguinus oedipus TaxID=9490 RepID=A0ABQ9WFA7_SAGOE|nr:Protein Niban 2 [Saguinus oedipus]